VSCKGSLGSLATRSLQSSNSSRVSKESEEPEESEEELDDTSSPRAQITSSSWSHLTTSDHHLFQVEHNLIYTSSRIFDDASI